MLRMSIAAGLMFLSAPALAQRIDEVKAVAFGTGCVGPFAKIATKLGSCTVGDAKTRIWCPGGKVFERTGTPPQPPVIRSICGLNQV